METKIEKVILPDGRSGERHTRIDSDGNEVIEIYGLPASSLELEQTIHRKMTSVCSEEVVSTVRDGEVIGVERKTIYPEVPLQLRERLAYVAQAAPVAPAVAPVPAQDLAQTVAAAVTEGMRAFFGAVSPDETVQAQSMRQEPMHSARALVESRVTSGLAQDSDQNNMWVLGGIFCVECLIVAALLLFF
jgi:hypothetical protein